MTTVYLGPHLLGRNLPFLGRNLEFLARPHCLPNEDLKRPVRTQESARTTNFPPMNFEI